MSNKFVNDFEYISYAVGIKWMDYNIKIICNNNYNVGYNTKMYFICHNNYINGLILK